MEYETLILLYSMSLFVNIKLHTTSIIYDMEPPAALLAFVRVINRLPVDFPRKCQ